ncbi:hypothetical protein OG381_31315 [Streptomyces sp. NBC_00490]|uniref:hypothetical protein n=1 Tax=Streptomyces sp. NBC_00490 TaxID=2903657 RepID=UPI002E190CBD
MTGLMSEYQGNAIAQVLTDSAASPARVMQFDILKNPGPRVWIAGFACAATIATSTFVGSSVAEALSLSEQTTSPAFASPEEESITAEQRTSEVEVVPLSAEELVKLIHDESGLTWEQLSRVLGVSRRSVHLWASGGRVNARHGEMLVRLAEIIKAAPVVDPSRVRAWLFASRPGEGSPLEIFQEQYRKRGAPVQGVGYTPAQLLSNEAE